jgi:hypothetical protein
VGLLLPYLITYLESPLPHPKKRKRKEKRRKRKWKEKRERESSSLLNVPLTQFTSFTK